MTRTTHSCQWKWGCQASKKDGKSKHHYSSKSIRWKSVLQESRLCPRHLGPHTNKNEGCGKEQGSIGVNQNDNPVCIDILMRNQCLTVDGHNKEVTHLILSTCFFFHQTKLSSVCLSPTSLPPYVSLSLIPVCVSVCVCVCLCMSVQWGSVAV